MRIPPIKPGNLLLLGLSGLVSLVGAELILRALAPTRFYIWPPGLSETFHPSPRYLPGVGGLTRFTINAQGLRSEGPLPGGPGYRILTIGGSSTICTYLDDAEAWPRLLQDALNEPTGEKPVWVGNAGMSGLNTMHHVHQVRHLLGQFPNIDVLILLVGANDLAYRLALDTAYVPYDRLPPAEQDRVFKRAFSYAPAAFRRGTFVRRTELWYHLNTLKAAVQEVITRRQYAEDYAGEVYAVWRSYRQSASAVRSALPDLDTALEDFAFHLRTIAGIAAEHGTRVVFVTQPSLWRADLPGNLQALLWLGGIGDFQLRPGGVYYAPGALAGGLDQFNETLLQTCREAGAVCIDLAPHVPRDTSAFYDDLHFNEAGARLVAARLAEALQGAGLTQLTADGY